MLDSSSFHPRRSARDHLRRMSAAAGIARPRIDEVLGEVDLTGAGDRRVGEFSLGMRHRLGLAAARLGDPQLLILDEPANGLDPAGIRWLRQWLRSFARGGGTVAGNAPAVRVRSGEPERLAKLLVAAGARVEGGATGTLHVQGLRPEQVGAAALRGGVVLHELVTERHSLEGVFLELTEKEESGARVASG